MIKSFNVNYIRDGLVEEFHTGVVQYGVEGDDLTPYYLRSCAKPLQASLLIDYNLNFSKDELAFCSGSHAGEACHIEIAREILKKINLDEGSLQCGIHAPLSKTMRDKMLLRCEQASSLHNNCSGKHLGFLAICKKNHWDLDTYYKPEHPLQIEVRRKIYELCEITAADNIEQYPVTTDGCGVPIVSMPLKHLVKGFQNLSKQYPQLVEAIIENPYIYGGEDRLDTEIMQNTKHIIAKVGAGGLCVVYNTDKNEGFAVKMNDASMPARRIATLEIINRLGWADIEFDKTIKTLSGKIVGHVQVEI